MRARFCRRVTDLRHGMSGIGYIIDEVSLE